MSGNDMTCDDARRSLSLGEPGQVEDHLRTCGPCRSEAEQLEPILQALRSDPVAEVPALLDRSVRAALAGQESVAPSRMSLPIVLALSATATLALIASVAITLANMYPVGMAMVRGLVLGVAYIAISSVATLPLFIRRARSPLEARQWR